MSALIFFHLIIPFNARFCRSELYGLPRRNFRYIIWFFITNNACY